MVNNPQTNLPKGSSDIGRNVVKTYPPIDPIVAPPPDINYILCVTFITASVT